MDPIRNPNNHAEYNNQRKLASPINQKQLLTTLTIMLFSLFLFFQNLYVFVVIWVEDNYVTSSQYYNIILLLI